MKLHPDDYSHPGERVDYAPLDEHMKAVVAAIYAARVLHNQKTVKANQPKAA